MFAHFANMVTTVAFLLSQSEFFMTYMGIVVSLGVFCLTTHLIYGRY